MSVKKFRLFETFEEFNNAKNSSESRLGIPNENTQEYCESQTVTNPNHSKYGKFIFPVIPSELNYYKDGQIFDYEHSWYKDYDKTI